MSASHKENNTDTFSPETAAIEFQSVVFRMLFYRRPGCASRFRVIALFLLLSALVSRCHLDDNGTVMLLGGHGEMCECPDCGLEYSELAMNDEINA